MNMIYHFTFLQIRSSCTPPPPHWKLVKWCMSREIACYNTGLSLVKKSKQCDRNNWNFRRNSKWVLLVFNYSNFVTYPYSLISNLSVGCPYSPQIHRNHASPLTLLNERNEYWILNLPLKRSRKKILIAQIFYIANNYNPLRCMFLTAF
jgi:hypothetical protein